MKKVILLALILTMSIGAGKVVCGSERVATDVEEKIAPPHDIYEGQPMEDLDMEEVKLLAAVIWAEAEGESMYGKKMVGSVILNRRDDKRGYFPDTIIDVINQPGQFTVVGNGRLWRGYYLQEPSCVQAAMEELMERTDHNVLFFCAGGWGYGDPYMQVGNHYFSTLY